MFAPDDGTEDLLPRSTYQACEAEAKSDEPCARQNPSGITGLRVYELTQENEEKERKLRQLRQVCAALRDRLRALNAPGSCSEEDNALPQDDERFQQIADAVEDVVWIAEPTERRIVYVSPSYERLWGRPKEAIYGNNEDWIEAIHPADRERTRESLKSGLLDGRYETEYRIIRPDGRLLWIRDRGFVVTRDEGLPRRMVGIATDITDRKQAEAALAASEEQSRAQLAELNAVYDTAPVGLCVLDRDYRYVRVNKRLAETNGSSVRDHIGRTLREIIPDMADRAEEMVRRILATGEVVRTELRGETTARPGVQRVWDSTWFPLRGARGDIVAVNVVAEEVTEQKRAEEHRELLMRELNHRVRNTLLIVQSVAEQTARSSASIDVFKQTFASRLAAISRSHDLLTRDGWTSAPLRDVLGEALAPYDEKSEDPTSPPRIRLDGPDVQIKPNTVITLSMALHELATNAAKYGSLSTPSGRVAARWTIANGGAGKPDALEFTWQERDGPLVTCPTHRGFGTRLIENGLAKQLEAEVALRFEEQGVECRIRLPAARVLAA